MIERKFFLAVLTVFFLFGAAIGVIVSKLYFVPDTKVVLVYDVFVNPKNFRE